MGGLIHGDPAAPSPEPTLREDTIHVQAVERDNGIKTATYNSISSALYDLADTNSKTHTVQLPQGTKVKLVAPMRPGLGAYRAGFEVIPPKGDPQQANGSASASDLAKDLDVLALSGKQKTALQQMTEGELEALAEEHLPKLQESEVNVSGYVTHNGRHVGAYSQIRKIVASLRPGQTATFPEGIKVSREKPHQGISSDKFVVRSPHAGSYAQPTYGMDAAARIVGSRSASSTHPKSIGGGESHKGINDSKGIDAVPAKRGSLIGGGSSPPKASAGRPGARAPLEINEKAGAAKPGEKILTKGGSYTVTGKDHRGYIEVTPTGSDVTRLMSPDEPVRRVKSQSSPAPSAPPARGRRPGPKGPRRYPKKEAEAAGGEWATTKNLQVGDQLFHEGKWKTVKEIGTGGTGWKTFAFEDGSKTGGGSATKYGIKRKGGNGPARGKRKVQESAPVGNGFIRG